MGNGPEQRTFTMAKPAAAGGAAAPDKKGKKKTFKKKERKHIPHGLVHVQASFNNTIVTITDMAGNVISWKSSGSLGFRGSRKGTPSPRSRLRRTPPTWRGIMECGRSMCGSAVPVRAANRQSGRWLPPASKSRSIKDFTPIPHNGCRPPKRRRV